MNAILLKRVVELELQRQPILAEIAGLERERAFPVDLLSPKHIQAFRRALRAEILAEVSEFGKRYLDPLVEKIRVEGHTAMMQGGEPVLTHPVTMGTNDILGTIPTFGPGWLRLQAERRS